MKCLEVGGGANESYHPNIDVREIPGHVDIVWDLEQFPYPFEAESFDFIYGRFVMEHINWRYIEDFIKELYRLVKKDGSVVMIVPNLRAQAMMLVSKQKWTLKDDVCMIFGDNDYEDNSHKASLSPELAEELFRNAGFKDIHIDPLINWKADMEITAIKS